MSLQATTCPKCGRICVSPASLAPYCAPVCRDTHRAARDAACKAARQAALEAELARPSYPPKAPLGMYPKRGPGGLLTAEIELGLEPESGLAMVSVACGARTWVEVTG